MGVMIVIEESFCGYEFSVHIVIDGKGYFIFFVV